MMGFIAAEAARGAQDEPASFETIRRALAHGTVIASFNIESFSLDRLTTLTREDVVERYGEFIKMVRVD